MIRFGLVALLASACLIGPSPTRADVFATILSGPAEAPPNASPGFGFAVVTFDPVAHILRVEASFSGLLGPTTAAHIHSATAVAGTGTAGVATQTPTFMGFPTGVTSGVYDATFDTSLAASWNAAYITANGGTTAGAEAALFAGLTGGKAYFNLHTSVFPGGEIRGFLTAVPEPSPLPLALLGGGLALSVNWIKRSRKTAS